MAVWAFNTPNHPHVKFAGDSAKVGKPRFGWSWFDGANLNLLSKKEWGKMSKDEKDSWRKSRFLLDIKKGDWIVHINLPVWGKCIVGQVVEEYSFESFGEAEQDFRHFFKTDIITIIEFDRNDANVHPMISQKLKLRGRYWRIYAEKEFLQSLDNLNNNRVSIEQSKKIGTYYLKEELNTTLKKITEQIHKTHPRKDLEYFIADIFKNIPNVIDVKVNGSGWGTDFGADIIVKYTSGLDFLNFQKVETLVVQVKSYAGTHWETEAVEQIEKAMEEFSADTGLLITTGESSKNLEKAIEELGNRVEKPVSLLAGEDVAKFVLKYEKGLLINI